MVSIVDRQRRLRDVVMFFALLTILASLGTAWLSITGHPWQLTAVWVLAAAFLASFAVLSVVIASVLIKLASTTSRQLDELKDLNEAVQQQLRRLGELVLATQISDAARSLVNRDADLHTLREAIRATIRREDWEGAAHLVEQIEERFGYHVEAEEFREEIREAKSLFIEQKLAKVSEQIEQHCVNREWALATQEVERLERALPQERGVREVREQLNRLRDARKEELRLQWEGAVANSDVDHAIEILKELDIFLAPEEARALENEARHIFKEKLAQMGVRFRFAVKEKRWHDALEVGAELMREFPNSRMAKEVQQKLDILRELSHRSPRSPSSLRPSPVAAMSP